MGNEKRRSKIMTMARIQHFCGAKNIKIGYFDGMRNFPRIDSERNKALFYTIIVLV